MQEKDLCDACRNRGECEALAQLADHGRIPTPTLSPQQRMSRIRRLLDWAWGMQERRNCPRPKATVTDMIP